MLYILIIIANFITIFIIVIKLICYYCLTKEKEEFFFKDFIFYLVKQ